MQGSSVAKFKNLSALKNITDKQKELLKGNYEIHIND